MPEITKIPTENPRKEQWQLLSQYGYAENVLKYLNRKPTVLMGEDLPEYVAGCINQGQAYFTAFSVANLDISPLLLYYGSANLMFGVATLLSGYKRQIHHHGLKLQFPSSANFQIADFKVRPCNEIDGSLQWFLHRFSDGTGISINRFGDWTLGEIFGSIPDLRADFENCYPSGRYYTIPVTIDSLETKYREEKPKTKTVQFEVIAANDLSRFSDPHKVLLSVPGFQDAYLVPTRSEVSQIDIYRKMHSEEIGFYTIYGRKFLEIPHQKGQLEISPGQLILLFMGLFALGHISRYYPQFWNAFVRGDTTGERLVVERFLSISERYVPNLLLNHILSSRVEFYHPGNIPESSGRKYFFE